MPRKTAEEIYKYVLNYKNTLKDNYNSDQEKHFDTSNELKMQLSNQLIVFSSLLLSIGAGYLLSNHGPDITARNYIVGAIFTFAFSVAFGLYDTYSASEFHLEWARGAHDKGGMVYKDQSKTVEELDKLLVKVGKRDKLIKNSSSKIPFACQILFFTTGIGLVLVAVCLVAYH